MVDQETADLKSSHNVETKRLEKASERKTKKLKEFYKQEIEKLKKQQDKLLLSERHSAWENVARKLAHEIKNPLTPIQLIIDNLNAKYLENIDKGIQKLLSNSQKK